MKTTTTAKTTKPTNAELSDAELAAECKKYRETIAKMERSFAITAVAFIMTGIATILVFALSI